jgi:transcriptional regulator with XRE-family HTH domain
MSARVPVAISSRAQSTRSRSGATFRALAINLIRLRTLEGLTQTELAEAAEISRGTLNALEAGHATGVQLYTIQRLAAALRVRVDELLALGFSEALPFPDPVLSEGCLQCGAVRLFRASRPLGPCQH